MVQRVNIHFLLEYVRQSRRFDQVNLGKVRRVLWLAPVSLRRKNLKRWPVPPRRGKENGI